jgi:hypothetical protein
MGSPSRDHPVVDRPLGVSFAAVRSLLLLPSSETKAPGGEGSWDPAESVPAALAKTRRQVARALARTMRDREAAARITGIKGPAHALAVAANRKTVGGPGLPAGQRYQGVVWDHLDAATLPPSVSTLAGHWVVIVSALTGAARFADPIPDYKLKMSARLDPLGGLARLWRAPVTAAVRAWAADADMVIDLLPGDHARVVAFDELAKPVIHVAFTTATGLAAGHGAKAAKGTVARHLLSSGDDPLKALADFEWSGWHGRATEDPTRFEIALA